MIMNLRTIRKKDGSVFCLVNMDHLVAAYPMGEDEMYLVFDDGNKFTVSRENFREMTDDGESESEKRQRHLVRQLTEAMERLVARFPTSIRVRM